MAGRAPVASTWPRLGRIRNLGVGIQAREKGARSVIEQPHTEDCRGCVADRLTESDRAHLAANGWTHPGHTYRRPDEMPPRPVRQTADARAASGSQSGVVSLTHPQGVSFAPSPIEEVGGFGAELPPRATVGGKLP